MSGCRGTSLSRRSSAHRAITVPVLIEAGAEDPASANLPTFRPRLSGPACTQVFPDANHFAWVDSPDLPGNLAQPEYRTATATAAVNFIQQALATGAPTPSADVTCD